MVNKNDTKSPYKIQHVSSAVPPQHKKMDTENRCNIQYLQKAHQQSGLM